MAAGARRLSALPDLSHQAVLPGQFRYSQDTAADPRLESLKQPKPEEALREQP